MLATSTMKFSFEHLGVVDKRSSSGFGSDDLHLSERDLYGVFDHDGVSDMEHRVSEIIALHGDRHSTWPRSIPDYRRFIHGGSPLVGQIMLACMRAPGKTCVRRAGAKPSWAGA